MLRCDQPGMKIYDNRYNWDQPITDVNQYNTGYSAGKRKEYLSWLRKPKGRGVPRPFGLSQA